MIARRLSWLEPILVSRRKSERIKPLMRYLRTVPIRNQRVPNLDIAHLRIMPSSSSRESIIRSVLGQFLHSRRRRNRVIAFCPSLDGSHASASRDSRFRRHFFPNRNQPARSHSVSRKHPRAFRRDSRADDSFGYARAALYFYSLYIEDRREASRDNDYTDRSLIRDVGRAR